MQASPAPTWQIAARRAGLRAADNAFHAPKQSISELTAAEPLKDEFLAILGHELRSPLVAVQNAVRILSGDAGRNLAVQQRMHALIERQVRHMTLLTAGLRDVSRISRGELHLQCERVDLRVVLADAIETMEPQWQQRGQTLGSRWPAGPEEPVWLQGDAERLAQVFQNLLGNACKYSDFGAELTLSLEVSDRCAVVCVRDRGIGIAPEALPHIFELFMQVDRAAAHDACGLGIGLALVRTLVELHGGVVTALSAGVGQGSEFIVRLPVEP
jgi:signal transduction histidine kinase